MDVFRALGAAKRILRELKVAVRMEEDSRKKGGVGENDVQDGQGGKRSSAAAATTSKKRMREESADGSGRPAKKRAPPPPPASSLSELIRKRLSWSEEMERGPVKRPLGANPADSVKRRQRNKSGDLSTDKSSSSSSSQDCNNNSSNGDKRVTRRATRRKKRTVKKMTRSPTKKSVPQSPPSSDWTCDFCGKCVPRRHGRRNFFSHAITHVREGLFQEIPEEEEAYECYLDECGGGPPKDFSTRSNYILHLALDHGQIFTRAAAWAGLSLAEGRRRHEPPKSVYRRLPLLLDWVRDNYPQAEEEAEDSKAGLLETLGELQHKERDGQESLGNIRISDITSLST